MNGYKKVSQGTAIPERDTRENIQVQNTADGGCCQAPPYSGEQLYDDRLIELSKKMKEVINGE